MNHMQLDITHSDKTDGLEVVHKSGLEYLENLISNMCFSLFHANFYMSCTRSKGSEVHPSRFPRWHGHVATLIQNYAPYHLKNSTVP